MRSIEQLTAEILSLPSESRALLADRLIESLEFDTDSAIQAVWVTEAKRRRDEVRDGSVQPIAGEEALAQVRRLIDIVSGCIGIISSRNSETAVPYPYPK